MFDLLRRKEGIQRIQFGLFGLAGVVLLVGLANVVVDNVRREENIVMDGGAETAANAAVAIVAQPVVEPPKEPLAELGVTPVPEAAQAPVVADLQPDPNLREPMDQPQPVPPQMTPPVQSKPAPKR